jgi:hypothetical protein
VLGCGGGVVGVGAVACRRPPRPPSPFSLAEGLRGIFAGMSVTALIAGPTTATYFGAYHLFRERGSAWAGTAPGAAPPAAVVLAAGGAAEFTASMLFVPFDVIKTRLQLGANPSRATGGVVPDATNFRGMVDAGRQIVRREGWRGLWQGWNSSLLQDVTFSALQFYFYERFKRQVASSRGHELAPWEHFVCGGAAGAAAGLLTNPLDVITTRMQAQGAGRRFGGGMVAVARQAAAEGGLALWRGSVARSLSHFPFAAIQFSLFEWTRKKLLAWGVRGDGGGARGE